VISLELSAGERAFQQQVCAFFEREYPAAILQKVRSGQRLTREDHLASQRALHSRGWFATGWPREHGGPGWTPLQRYLFEAELERIGAPALIPMAVIYIGPVIIAFGTVEQQQRWLPDILESRALWAQGYSEPEAGSDLASLALQAVREGDHYVLDGAKIWTTLAQWADWIFCLVRTSRGASRQEGITFLCVDMKSPGIEVHPITMISGAEELNRVTFSAVRVPMDNRIGEEGRGWFYANELLKNERLSYAHVGRKKADLVRLRGLAGAVAAAVGRTLLDAPLFAARLAALEIEVATLEIAVLRALSAATGAEISMLKIRCTECAQRVTELGLEVAARDIAPYPSRERPEWQAALRTTPAHGVLAVDAYLYERAQTIYGGTTEIQKNIIWRHLSRQAR
jgi:alkylation response protein AidB-like acyl-CoA dehydrogenase